MERVEWDEKYGKIDNDVLLEAGHWAAVLSVDMIEGTSYFKLDMNKYVFRFNPEILN